MLLRKTRKTICLDPLNQVVPWSRLVDLNARHCPTGQTSHPPFELETLLRTHFLQQWFDFSDLGVEEAFFDTPLYG